MATEKQIAANRANGARSRGPKTPEGKARSARNSTRHGLLARPILRDGESRDRFDDLLHLLNSSLQPRTAIDELLIGKMAVAHWRQTRLWTLERQGDQTLGDYEMRLDRQFLRTLDRYLKLRTLSGESNPISPALSAAKLFPEPNSEPKPPQPEPKSTQSEPDRPHHPSDGPPLWGPQPSKDDPAKGDN